MAVTKSKTGWTADFRNADGKRIRKTFVTRGEALRFEREEKDRGNVDVQLSDTQSDSAIKLSELVKKWYELHGRSLSDADARLNKLLSVCKYLNDIPALELSQEVWATYRNKRLSGAYIPKDQKDKRKPPGESTVNREHSYMRAVFNELKRLGHWRYPNPLDGIRLFREAEKELAFLRDEEITRLLYECDQSDNKDLGLVVRLCLATGARWGEVQDLKKAQVIKGKVTFIDTKGKRNRSVPISDELYERLPVSKGKLFKNSYNAFRDAVERAKIELPAGQLTHVLRHTFASHFMMNGGNILILQKILGHTDITMTMRYAHFAPEHLEDAVKLNPYDRLSKKI